VETNGERTACHDRLQSLVGDWTVKKENYLAGPRPDEPVRGSGLVARKEWTPGLGVRFLTDTTWGKFGGQPYFRVGVIGFSIIDHRYEWNTVDGANAMMMTYKGDPHSGSDEVISMSGVFTHAGGLYPDELIGASIAQRTEIRIESPDRHVIDIFFAAPGEGEVLADHGVYTRAQAPSP
jgi:hypothetical protein